MNATCRPGGGPATDGLNADRNDPLIQRAWYNGWKKLHGMKWQTVDLPNGMNCHTWSPFSVRHPDLFSVRQSNINDLLAAVMVGRTQCRIYGDSAYIVLSSSHIRARHCNAVNTDRETLENKVMSSCRETIEWDYGDVGRYFPLANCKEVLKMRNMPVEAMYLTAMLLRKALNTINPSNTSQYFHLNPPKLEEWLAEGPAARPNLEPVIIEDWRSYLIVFSTQSPSPSPSSSLSLPLFSPLAMN